MKRYIALIFVLLLVLSGCQGKTVMKCEDIKLSNTEFSYYYWSEYFYSEETLKEQADLTKPLDEQMYDETATWQDHLIDNVLAQVEETMCLVLAAKDAGFELPAEYEETLDDVMVNFIDSAMGMGYKNTSAYLKSLYGKGADEESFRAYLYDTHMASAYADELYKTSVPTEEEALAYMEKNPAAYQEGGLEQAIDDLHAENYNNAILTVINAYDFTVRRDNIRITAPKGLYEN